MNSSFGLRLLAITGAGALFATQASAAILFSENFDSGALGSNLIQASAGGTLTLNGATAEFSGGRNYVGTVDSDYATANFDWTASIDVQHTGFGSNQLFFGLGSGTIETQGAPEYGEPQGNGTGEAATYFSMQDAANSRSLVTIGKTSVQGYFGGQQDFSDTQFDSLLGTTGGVASGSFYRYYLDYNHTDSTLSLSMSTLSGFGGTAGPTVLFRTVNLTGAGYTGSTGGIFFGGDGGSTFDNFVVVPEPGSATAIIGGAAILLGLRRRRIA